MKLYKVKVETEIMVVADTDNVAAEVAKTNAAEEVLNYGKCTVVQVTRNSEIPNDWKNVIPYAPKNMTETKKCIELVTDVGFIPKQGLEKDEIDHIIKIQETKKDSISEGEVKPETRPDPKPKEMDWHDTRSGRPVTRLRFLR